LFTGEKKMIRKNIVAVFAMTAVGAMALTGCTTIDPVTGERVTDNAKTAALIGAAVGAGFGYATNKNPEQGRKNAVIGAGVGALAGAAIGDYMDKQQAELRKKLEGTGVDVTRDGDKITLNMPGDVTFATNSDVIATDFYKVLNDVAGVLAKYPSTYIDITGHADSRGTDAYNLDLSQRRAASAAKYITTQGVDAQRLYVTGMGEAKPKASNLTDAGRAQNRRVEIELRPVT
jgi:outer membrane protein OmpA-like peptidoglycan-associated protein